MQSELIAREQNDERVDCVPKMMNTVFILQRWQHSMLVIRDSHLGFLLIIIFY